MATRLTRGMRMSGGSGWGGGLLVLWAVASAGLRPLHAADVESPFDRTAPWEIRLTFTAQEWKAMTPVEKGAAARDAGGGGEGRGPGGGPGWAEREYPWSRARFEAGPTVLSGVAVRFKGNSSYNETRDSWKRPLRLDFNRGAKGRTWLGVEELSLNNNLHDATQFREAMAYAICHAAGVAAPRTAFATLRLTVEGEVTNRLAGTYTLVEVVEGDFLKSRFGTSQGLLLKPERLRGLEYLGEDWSRYGERYEPKTTVRTEDAQRLIGLTRLVAQGADEEFRRELGQRIDVPAFLRFVAVVAWLGNYDSFVGNGHNYYLFLPAEGARAVFVPWDMNEAFGGHPGAGPRQRQAAFSILRPQASSNRLIERVLAQPEWSAMYRREVERLQGEICTTNRLAEWTAHFAAAVAPAVREESGAAWNAFRRVARGESGMAADEGPGPTPGRRMPAPGRGEDGTFPEWWMARWQNVAGELAGSREPVIPSMGRGPGGPRLGGPGGLVPAPPRRQR